jgi:hypothetical protein
MEYVFFLLQSFPAERSFPPFALMQKVEPKNQGRPKLRWRSAGRPHTPRNGRLPNVTVTTLAGVALLFPAALESTRVDGRCIPPL